MSYYSFELTAAAPVHPRSQGRAYPGRDSAQLRATAAAARLAVLPTTGSSFLDDTPTAKLVRQVLGAIAEFDKANTVAKLRGARERRRRDTGKCEGRKAHAEVNPALVAEASGYGGSCRRVASGLCARSPPNSRGEGT